MFNPSLRRLAFQCKAHGNHEGDPVTALRQLRRWEGRCPLCHAECCIIKRAVSAGLDKPEFEQSAGPVQGQRDMRGALLAAQAGRARIVAMARQPVEQDRCISRCLLRRGRHCCCRRRHSRCSSHCRGRSVGNRFTRHRDRRAGGGNRAWANRRARFGLDPGRRHRCRRLRFRLGFRFGLWWRGGRSRRCTGCRAGQVEQNFKDDRIRIAQHRRDCADQAEGHRRMNGDGRQQTPKRHVPPRGCRQSIVERYQRYSAPTYTARPSPGL